MTADRPIRVLHVGKFYAPVEGGIENVVKELVTAFDNSSGIESSVLVAQRKGVGSTDVVDGFTVHRVASRGTLFGTPLSSGFVRTVERMAAHFDIVHVHVPNPLLFFCDWEATRRSGTRLVIHHHSDIVRPVQRNVLRLLRSHERRFYRAAHAVITTSQRLLENSRTLAPYRDKCHVLPLTIDVDALRCPLPGNREQTRARLGYVPGHVVFLFLGRLVYYKGIDDLLRATALAANGRKDIKVVIGGAGPLQKDLQTLCRQLRLSKDVQFLGRVPEEDLPGLFAAADVFVLPSNAASEAFGVVQLEAMAHGLPVINTALPTGVPEVSLHQVSGLTVPPRNAHALGNAMTLLARDESLRKKLGDGALARVRKFTRPKIVTELRELYRNVVLTPIRTETRAQQPALHGLRDHVSQAGETGNA